MSAPAGTGRMADRYLEQRKQALERANAVRMRRVEERTRLRSMPLTDARHALGELIIECPDWLRSAPVRTALLWLPWFGPGALQSLARRHHLQVLVEQQVGELSERGRLRLAAVLGYYPQAGGEA